MKLNEHIGPNVVVLAPEGRLTAETVAMFSEAVARWIHSGFVKIVLDLEHVNYIDSAGLGGIVQAFTWCRQAGGRMVLVNVTGKNKDLLEITKLLTVVECYDGLAEAERSFAGAPA